MQKILLILNELIVVFFKQIYRRKVEISILTPKIRWPKYSGQNTLAKIR
jgi:hypothetical protein